MRRSGVPHAGHYNRDTILVFPPTYSCIGTLYCETVSCKPTLIFQENYSTPTKIRGFLSVFEERMAFLVLSYSVRCMTRLAVVARARSHPMLRISSLSLLFYDICAVKTNLRMDRGLIFSDISTDFRFIFLFHRSKYSFVPPI